MDNVAAEHMTSCLLSLLSPVLVIPVDSLSSNHFNASKTILLLEIVYKALLEKKKRVQWRRNLYYPTPSNLDIVMIINWQNTVISLFD